MHEKGSENGGGSSLLPDPARRPAHYTESAGELAGPWIRLAVGRIRAGFRRRHWREKTGPGRRSQLAGRPITRRVRESRRPVNQAGPARSLNQVGGQGNREKVRLRTAGRA